MYPVQSLQGPEEGGKMAEVREAETAYKDAKRMAKHTVLLAKYEAKKEDFARVSPDGDGVFPISKQEVIGENCVCHDADKMHSLMKAS